VRSEKFVFVTELEREREREREQACLIRVSKNGEGNEKKGAK
jgi:hypothetical protein